MQNNTYRTASRLELETEMMTRSITLQLAKIDNSEKKVDNNNIKFELEGENKTSEFKNE